jgi:plastocyanin domain-containing protein
MNIKKSNLQNIVKLIVGAVVLIFIAVLLFGDNSKKESDAIGTANNSGDIQIIEITAKGGYSPKLVEAKAGVSSTLKIITDKTFDCSSALTIPKLGVDRFLPSTGITEFEIKPQASGTEITGSCSMGMYGFKIKFK